jgi:ABC-type branched-subunit amino acid transport system permease subunit
MPASSDTDNMNTDTAAPVAGASPRRADSKPRVVGYLGKPPLQHVLLLVVGLVCLTSLFTTGSDYLLMSFVAVYTIASLGLNLIFGMGGMLSVAQGALVGVGAYTSALVMADAHWPFLVAALIGIALACVISTVVTLVAARVRTHYFVLVSLAVAEVLTLVETSASFTGGSNGLGGIGFMSVGGYAATTPRAQGIVGLVLLILAWYVADVFKASRLGRAVFVGSLNPELAATCGVSVLRSRVTVAAVGGGFAGVAGVLFAGTVGYLDPTSFTVNLALLLLVSLVVGGVGSIGWTVVASILFTYLNNGLSSLTTTGPLIYGIVVVAVLVVAPGGVASLVSRGHRMATARLLARRREYSPPVSSSGGEA